MLYRINHQRALESMQVSLNVEIKSKSELQRQKKKLESEINELEIGLDHTKRNLADLQNTNKKLQQNISEQQSQIEDEQRQKAELREAVCTAERHSNSLMVEIDELHVSLDQADRARKAIENELHDAAERLSEFGAANSNLAAQKRKADSDLASAQTDCDEALSQLKTSEERVKKATAEASRLTEELAREQVSFFFNYYISMNR
jgi:myosin heavy chain 6/7